MATNSYDSWAVDLANISAIYPFQGSEFFLTIAGLIFWLGWHWFQIRRESAHFENVQELYDPEKVKEYLKRY